VTRHRGWGGWSTRERPPWWPENEPFPPRRGWGGAPSRQFMRRMAMFFALVVVLSIAAATFVFWTIATALGAPDTTGSVARGVALLLLLMVLFGAGRSLRRITRPINDVIDAVGRVADGDLTARVTERGHSEARSLTRAFNAMASRLETSEEQRRRLLADVSHELRTPLSVVQGELEAIVDGVHPPDPAHLTAILDETKILARLVEDLRTISLAESGALALHREPTDIAALASEAIASFSAQAEGTGVALDADVATGLPLVDADPVRAREIIGNLISNALRYTPKGGRVHVAASRSDGAVVISVQDTGSGIAPDALGRVFDRFYKSAESRGAGLGLAIAKQLVEAHGGEISAASTPGQGTTMRFTLPVEPGDGRTT
jgi:two-component system, OmpR family, sensor histidine kinase BaeS